MAKKKNNFDLKYFKEYVKTYGEKENADMYSNETIVKDMLYGIGLSLDKEEYKERPGFVKFLKWLAGITASAMLLAFVGCSDGKQKNENISEEFDLSTIPCGTLIDAPTYGHLTVLSDDNKMLDVVVPGFVYNAYERKIGEKVGKCAQESPDATTEPETSENEE